MSADTACQIMNGTLANPALSRRAFTGVSVDTRVFRRGNAFFCLRGANSDGHRFALPAARHGAGVIVAERATAARWRRWQTPVIGVDDPLTALGDLASVYRRRFHTRYVAVTGSVGKTTTKELIAAALSPGFRVFKSPGNYNNLIGIPLALLARSESDDRPQVGALEFGMSTPGEIRRLTEMIEPSWGVVTRIGAAHLMQMRSVAAVARAKRELFDFAPRDLIAFLNVDDPYQRRWLSRWDRPTVTYGLGHAAQFAADAIQPTPMGVRFRVNGRHPFELRLAGEYNVPNALAAIAVGRRMGIPFDAMADALRRVRPVGERSRIVNLGRITLIADCYNANPVSMLAALRSLFRWPTAGRRVAVLGAMRELGGTEAYWHNRIGAAAQGLDLLIIVGDAAKAYLRRHRQDSARQVVCRDRAEALRMLERNLRPGDVVLLKASHAEGFEEVVKELQKRREMFAGINRGRRPA